MGAQMSRDKSHWLVAFYIGAMFVMVMALFAWCWFVSTRPELLECLRRTF